MTSETTAPRIAVINKTVLSDDQLADIDARYGAAIYHADDVISEDAAIERIGSAQIAVCNVGAPLTQRVIDACVNLQSIICASTGIDHVDAEACRARQICITSFPDYCAHALAEKALTFVLMGLNRIAPATENVKAGGWDYDGFLGLDLEEATIGIVGTGHSGNHLAHLARQLGMKVLTVNSRSSEHDVNNLLSSSDVISLHIPALPSTLNFINERRLGMMKTNVSLINISRGRLINEPALERFLTHNPKAVALLDVLCDEPPLPGNPLLSLPNVVVTPHIAWNSVRSDKKLNTDLLASIHSEADRLTAAETRP